jgi:putative ABC transport system permease protein
MLITYLKIAWRSLKRGKVFSLINLGGLALGLTCCILILLYIKDEKSFDRFQFNGNDLYRIKVTLVSPNDSMTIASTNAIHGPSFKNGIPEIREIIRTQTQPFVAKKGDDILSTDILFADPQFFEVFSFPLLYGNPTSVLSDIGSIVISEEMAFNYFGRTDAVGQVIELKVNDEFVPFTVTGVSKSVPQNSTIQFDSVISFEWQVANGWTNEEWLGFYMNTFVLVDSRADFQKVGPKMDEIFRLNAAQELDAAQGFDSKVSFTLQPFMDIHWDNGIDSD